MTATAVVARREGQSRLYRRRPKKRKVSYTTFVDRTANRICAILEKSPDRMLCDTSALGVWVQLRCAGALGRFDKGTRQDDRRSGYSDDSRYRLPIIANAIDALVHSGLVDYTVTDDGVYLALIELPITCRDDLLPTS